MKESEYNKIEKLLADYPQKDDVLSYIKKNNTIEGEGRKFSKAEVDKIVKILVNISENLENSPYYSDRSYCHYDDISYSTASSIRRKVERITAPYDRFCDMRYDSKTHSVWFDPTAT